MTIIDKIKLALAANKLMSLLDEERIMKDPQTTFTGIATAVVAIACIFLPIPEDVKPQIIGGITALGVAIVAILAKDAKSP